jgi:hypothetical protein
LDREKSGNPAARLCMQQCTELDKICLLNVNFLIKSFFFLKQMFSPVRENTRSREATKKVDDAPSNEKCDKMCAHVIP